MKAHQIPYVSKPQLDLGVAESIYERVCRTELSQPGACLIDLGTDGSSIDLRRFILLLKTQLSKVHTQLRPKEFLGFVTVGRYDQQHSTRPHIDNGPAESILILGYEISEIESTIEIADYSMCARDLGMSPSQFLVKHKPTTRECTALESYTQCLASFSSASHQVLVVNNSQAASFDSKHWQGVLHQAQIPNPVPQSNRIINSTMVAPYLQNEVEPVSEDVLDQFATSDIAI